MLEFWWLADLHLCGPHFFIIIKSGLGWYSPWVDCDSASWQGYWDGMMGFPCFYLFIFIIYCGWIQLDGRFSVTMRVIWGHLHSWLWCFGGHWWLYLGEGVMWDVYMGYSEKEWGKIHLHWSRSSILQLKQFPPNRGTRRFLLVLENLTIDIRPYGMKLKPTKRNISPIPSFSYFSSWII